MLGLMKKDFLLVRKQLLIVVGIMVFYTFILGSGKSFDYQIGLFGGYTVAFMAMKKINGANPLRLCPLTERKML